MLRQRKHLVLTFEGKSLIIKTFGLSQLIYILQIYRITDERIKRVEQIIFGNVWLGSRSEKERGVDRIKRSVLKKDYGERGLNITDVDCLNKYVEPIGCCW